MKPPILLIDEGIIESELQAPRGAHANRTINILEHIHAVNPTERIPSLCELVASLSKEAIMGQTVATSHGSLTRVRVPSKIAKAPT